MKNETLHIRICPRCGASYGRTPALSRADGRTLICPDCGTREALESIGVVAEEQEQILEAIHRSESVPCLCTFTQCSAVIFVYIMALK